MMEKQGQLQFDDMETTRFRHDLHRSAPKELATTSEQRLEGQSAPKELATTSEQRLEGQSLLTRDQSAHNSTGVIERKPFEELHQKKQDSRF